MNNNLRGLFFHFLVIIATFALSYFINLTEPVRNLVYGNMVFKIIIVILILYLYFLLGRGMSKKRPPREDILTGNLIIFISLLTIGIAFLGLRGRFFEVGPGGSYYRFPMDIFLYPELYILKLIGYYDNYIAIIVSSFVPGIVYFFSIKKSRAQMRRKRRLERSRRINEKR
ncbi:hypothetical protein [Peptoniphilus sp.]|uniref:hypothetical protein n=1 Tax=Peptoniphilus sp. TaxID=1971214 RepID=UPI0039961010